MYIEHVHSGKSVNYTVSIIGAINMLHFHYCRLESVSNLEINSNFKISHGCDLGWSRNQIL